MLYDPKDHYEPEETAADFKMHSKLYERFMKIKQSRLLKALRKKETPDEKLTKRKKLFQFLFKLVH